MEREVQHVVNKFDYERLEEVRRGADVEGNVCKWVPARVWENAKVS